MTSSGWLLFQGLVVVFIHTLQYQYRNNRYSQKSIILDRLSLTINM